MLLSITCCLLKCCELDFNASNHNHSQNRGQKCWDFLEFLLFNPDIQSSCKAVGLLLITDIKFNQLPILKLYHLTFSDLRGTVPNWEQPSLVSTCIFNIAFNPLAIVFLNTGFPTIPSISKVSFAGCAQHCEFALQTLIGMFCLILRTLQIWSDYYLFLKLKYFFYGKRFCRINDLEQYFTSKLQEFF
ncbi:hypothetical protein E2986_12693 [Frieseomelitta varia]|uniref:Uncharacterized protein n=1 Tax=Frieseomelitta varia TaxID=561572 RepID=A0A833RI54_9HYME|nr:hypothetical protein E2986_12693 [Frieseomelitta varia]